MMRIDFSRLLTNSINVVKENGNQLVKPLDNKISKFALVCFALLVVAFVLVAVGIQRNKYHLKTEAELQKEANKQPNPPQGIKSRLLHMIATGEVKEDNPKESTTSETPSANETQPTLSITDTQKTYPVDPYLPPEHPSKSLYKLD